MDEKFLRFCRDVLSVAVEGGISYWAKCSNFIYYVPSRICNGCDGYVADYKADEDWQYSTCRVTYWMSFGEPEFRTLTCDVIAQGIARLLAYPKLRDTAARRYLVADIEIDFECCTVDAEAADVIVQLGLFNEVVFG